MDSSAELQVPSLIPPGPVALLVGRSSSADVVIRHPTVSWRHATLRVQNGKLIVEDLTGKRTTRVNGRPIRAQALDDGELVEFGAVGYEVRGLSLFLIDRTQGDPSGRGRASDRAWRQDRPRRDRPGNHPRPVRRLAGAERGG
jgi:pSer/pThr/pTyr-binding forkhead associated (FHA) protein